MDHNLKDCRMTSSDFEMYSASMWTIFHVAIKNCFKILKFKIDAI
jgi:hypothetical protein